MEPNEQSAVPGLFQTLSEPWKVAVQQAWQACRAGTLPIGSALADRSGRVVACGHNLRLADHATHPFAGSSVAHAEILTLGSVKHKAALQDFVLYSTLEPCPMCAGAIRMAGVGRVCFASRDPLAGGMDLFRSNKYMQAGRCDIQPPGSRLLEDLLIALLMERLINLAPDGVGRSIGTWSAISPGAVAFGQWLARGGVIEDMRRRNVPVEASFAILEKLYGNESRAESVVPGAGL
ncbi:MAG: nucleoside deaminase [Parvibaculum sedimenti]|uniref:nucleoside deaminase n=1 Tax=Parvibaculum sedimenti TaxID=2608632 RepID=UPI003BB4F561